jgi:hypothetical protein
MFNVTNFMCCDIDQFSERDGEREILIENHHHEFAGKVHTTHGKKMRHID